MASLLVSVRSATEARAALEGGAAVIDVKEPDRGPLGRADASVWSEVRAAVPNGTPVSVALGELTEWVEGHPRGELTERGRLRGFAFRKVGLAGSGPDWVESWERLRRAWTAGPSWVAVIYADWERARAPHPDRVLDAALTSEDCMGVLVDTWDKSAPTPVDASWARWFRRASDAGRLTALAGRLDPPTIARLSTLHPDLIAVRGAACIDGNRLNPVDPGRVAELARAAAAI